MNDNSKIFVRSEGQSPTTNPSSEQQFSHKIILTEFKRNCNIKFLFLLG